MLVHAGTIPAHKLRHGIWLHDPRVDIIVRPLVDDAGKILHNWREVRAVRWDRGSDTVVVKFRDRLPLIGDMILIKSDSIVDVAVEEID